MDTLNSPHLNPSPLSGVSCSVTHKMDKPLVLTTAIALASSQQLHHRDLEPCIHGSPIAVKLTNMGRSSEPRQGASLPHSSSVCSYPIGREAGGRG